MSNSVKTLEINRIINSDCLTALKEMPDGTVDCLITSLDTPPYWYYITNMEVLYEK